MPLAKRHPSSRSRGAVGVVPAPPLDPRVLAVEIAAPIEDPTVGREQPGTAFERSRDDHAVGGITIEIIEPGRADADPTVDRSAAAARSQTGLAVLPREGRLRSSQIKSWVR
jgi:hypothetical protein